LGVHGVVAANPKDGAACGDEAAACGDEMDGLGEVLLVPHAVTRKTTRETAATIRFIARNLPRHRGRRFAVAV
jgi:hypothetical protein